MTGRDEERGALSAAISDAVVRVVHHYTGRGAERARATIGRDTITVAMADTLTQLERSLIDAGRLDLVTQVREALEDTMRSDLIAVVERLTERRVITSIGSSLLEHGMSCEIFILEEEGGGR